MHAQLMLALYRCGRQAEALELGRALHARLRDELGIEASPEVRGLYRDLLVQAPHLSLEPPEPASNLPGRLTSFVGRARELEEVVDLLRTERLVTLTGPGGIGKTRLAIEVARRLLPQFAGGVWWIDLGPVTDPGAVLEEVAAVLGVRAPGVDLADAVCGALSRRRALLLLDNCEHVAAAAAEAVARVLRATTGPRVLATSRRPLAVEGECRWTVPPLSLPPAAGSAAELAGSEAVQLFVERGRAASSSFALDAGNAEAVAEVCRRLDGVSLAIEMAAARLPVLSPQEIARHLDRRFALLELPATVALARHRTLEASFDASYALLSEQERTGFERLSAFVGPFDLEAAGAVGFGDAEPSSRALSGVGALVDASLLTAERRDGETRYRLLESVREYGAARLRRRGEEGEARRAHSAYHLDLAAGASSVLATPEFASWMPLLGRSYAELRQALAWSLEHDDRAVTLRAVPALRELWYRRGDAREAARWTTRMLAGDLTAVPRSLLAEVHNAAGLGAHLSMDFPAAASHLDEAVRLSRAAGYVRGLVFASWARAATAFAQGDRDSVRRHALEGLATCERAGDRWGRAGPLAILGNATLYGDGDLPRARALLEEALPLYRELGDTGSLVVLTLTPLSEAARRQRNLAAAERHAAEAVEIGSGTAWEAAALVSYAAVLDEVGEAVAAQGAMRRGLRVALDAGLGQWFRRHLLLLARSAARRALWEEAAVLLAGAGRDMTGLLLAPEAYLPLEERCREALGNARFEQLAAEGEAMRPDELVSFLASDELRGAAAAD